MDTHIEDALIADANFGEETDGLVTDFDTTGGDLEGKFSVLAVAEQILGVVIVRNEVDASCSLTIYAK